jgi:hypothetical protein
MDRRRFDERRGAPDEPEAIKPKAGRSDGPEEISQMAGRVYELWMV